MQSAGDEATNLDLQNDHGLRVERIQIGLTRFCFRRDVQMHCEEQLATAISKAKRRLFEFARKMGQPRCL